MHTLNLTQQRGKEHKRTQVKQSNRYTFYHETESQSGRRRCITPGLNLAEFDYLAMFGEELTENFNVAGSFHNSTQILPHELSQKQSIEFSEIAKVE